MPRMTGAATFAELRAIDPAIAVVLMSGHASNEEVQGLIDQGAAGFVPKPHSVEDLARMLAEALAART